MLDITTAEKTKVLSNIDTEYLLSRSDLRNTNARSQLQMISLNLYLDITWGGFNIDEISTNPPIAFQVVSYNSILVKVKFEDENILQFNSPSAFKFNEVLVNSGQCWDSTKHSFIVPLNGVYIFSFSMNLKNSNWVIEITVRREGNILFESNQILSNGKNAFRQNVLQTVSGSIVKMLTKNDSIFIEHSRFDFITGINNNYDQASFRGFLYKPTTHINAAWSAQMLNESPFSLREIFFEKNHDIAFTRVFINTGDVFNIKDQAKLIIPYSGVYYIILKAKIPPNNEIALFINGLMTQLKIRCYSTEFDNLFSKNVETFERSLLVQVTLNNSLSVRLISDYHQNEAYDIYFAGFIIAPT